MYKLTNKNKVCSIDTCDRKSYCKTFCNRHYRKFLLYGDPLKSLRNNNPPLICSKKDCNEPYRSKGLCRYHYHIRFNDVNRKRGHERRLQSLNHYSNNDPKCACCDEKIIEFLVIDHINGKGNKHRKIIGKNIYSWLKQKNYPKGFQVLCYNCNNAKRTHGICPHKRIEEN